jgi:hypothetical protein
LVTVGLLPPMLLFLTLQTLAELTVPGALAVVVDGLEGTFPPVVTLAVHGRQSPEELAGSWVGGGVEKLGDARVSADVSTGSWKTYVWAEDPYMLLAIQYMIIYVFTGYRHRRSYVVYIPSHLDLQCPKRYLEMQINSLLG